MSTAHLLGSAADGGAETYFLDLVRALAADGRTVAAVRPHAARQAALSAAGVTTCALPFGGPFDLATKPRLRGFFKTQDVRVAVAWMNRAARHTPRGPWARVGRLGGYYKLKNYRGFDALVANTDDIAAWAVRQGWPAERIRCIPNFAQADASATPLPRAELDTPEGAPLILGLGRLHPSKAHDVSLKVLAQIPHAYLWIAGAGPLEAALKAQALALGVADRVRFLGWRDDAARLYRAADLCLFPSRFEPLGNVVIQSWAHGLPIVAAASQGPGALIGDGEDGLLAPIDDVDALAAAARRLLADDDMRARFIAAGRERIEAEFGRDAVVAQWRALFTELEARRCAA